MATNKPSAELRRIANKERADVLRQECADLIDKAYIAFRGAGHPVGDYKRWQYAEFLLIQTVNELPENSSYEITGLMILRSFLTKEIASFGHERAENVGRDSDELRKT